MNAISLIYSALALYCTNTSVMLDILNAIFPILDNEVVVWYAVDSSMQPE